LSGKWIDLVHTIRPPRGIVLDMDSSVSPTHGEQENSVWNGHYACTCYHPLFVFNQFGDLERCALRPGNVHSADGWGGVLKPVVSRYQGKVSRIYFRADAAFAMPEVYEFLEAERIKYAIRIPTNQVLQDRIGYLLTRPVGRPPHYVRRSHASFSYQAGSWSKPRRVIAKVECPGELYPRVGFIVTNRIDDAVKLAKTGESDVAILDVNLNGQTVSPVAEILEARGLPFVFATGYGERGLPERFSNRPTLQKPFQQENLGRILCQAFENMPA
jgi:hypothetical protein